MAYPTNYSTAAHRAYDGEMTAEGGRLQNDLAELKICQAFMLAWIERGLDVARERGMHNGAFDDFLATAKDHFGDEIGHIENKLSNPWDSEIWRA
jgi:hypothetical protein